MQRCMCYCRARADSGQVVYEVRVSAGIYGQGRENLESEERHLTRRANAGPAVDRGSRIDRFVLAWLVRLVR